MPRIVSFLPAGTEIVYALGAGEQLVGRSHECDYPPSAAGLPEVSRPALELEGLPPEAVDRAVAARLREGQSLYEVDEELLDVLAPEVILTQDLCQVCAPSGNELSRALQALRSRPQVVWLSPRNLAEIEENIRAVAQAIGVEAVWAADRLIASNRARIEHVRRLVEGAPVRRVAFLEWIDPLFAAGHWVPEMIALAGGADPLGRAGEDSARVEWPEVLAGRPELVLVAPCGFRLARSAELARELPPVAGARVNAVDANAYFARPGPRAAEGIELLAHLFHPDRVAWEGPGRPWQEIR